MDKRVSKQHRYLPTDAWSGGRRNSESISPENVLRCLPVWPKDLSDRSVEGRKSLIAIIEREVRKERRLSLALNRCYDIARHAKLAQLLKDERRELSRLYSGQRSNDNRPSADKIEKRNGDNDRA
jgi:hypothetical protein